MKKYQLLLLLLLMKNLIFSATSWVFTSSEGVWFQSSTELTASCWSNYWSKSRLKLDGKEDTQYGTCTLTVKKNVYSTGVYYAQYYDKIGFNYDLQDSRKITIYKDSNKPVITFPGGINYQSIPSYYTVNINDTADTHAVVNTGGHGVINQIIINIYRNDNSIFSNTYSYNSSDWINNVNLDLTPYLSIEGKYSISISVSDHAGNIENGSKTIYVDYTAPTLNIYNSEDEVTNNTVVVKAEATDNVFNAAVIQYRKKGDLTWINYPNTGVPVSNNYIYEFRTYDSLNNFSPIYSHTINNIDLIPPDVFFSGNIDMVTNIPYELSLSFLDIGSEIGPFNDQGLASGVNLNSRYYKLNTGDDWQNYLSPITVSNNTKIYVKVEDNIGNKIGDDNTLYIDISNFDLIPPYFDEIKASASLINGYTAGPVYVSASAKDVGVSGVLKDILDIEYCINGDDNWLKYTAPVPISTNNTVIYFRASDALGNTSESYKNAYTVRSIDSTPPTFNYSYESKEFYNDHVTVTVSDISDLGESGVYSVEYNSNGGPWREVLYEDIINNQFSFNVEEDETNILIRSTDNVGNTTSEISYISFTVSNIDKLDPIVSNITPTTTRWTSEPVGLTATFSDLGGAGVEFNSRKFRVGTDGSWQNYPMGSKDYVTANTKVFFKVNDLAGNSTIVEYDVTNIDNTPPVINVTGNSDIWSSTGKVLTATAFDHESGISDNSLEYNDGSGSWVSYSAPIEVTSNRTVQFRVKNGAGETTLETLTIQYIDNDNPEISNPFSYGHYYTKENVTLKKEENIFSDNRSDVSGYYYFHNNSIGMQSYEVTQITRWGQYTERLDLTADSISEGAKWLYLKAVDEAGNITYSGYSFVVDNTKPKINFNLNYNKNGSSDTVANSSIIIKDFSLIESNPDTYTYFIKDAHNVILDSDNVKDPTKNLKIDLTKLPEGDYQVEVLVKDKSGNKGVCTKDFLIDRTPPGIDKITLDISNDEKSLGENDVTSSNGLNMTFSYTGNDIENPRYQYFVSKTLPAQITDVTNELSDFDESSVMTFDNGVGLYYVYFYIIDDAGNRSEDYNYRQIRFNSNRLPTPEISGVKEALDITDVITYNNPQFTFSPKLTDHNGLIDYGDLFIIGYEYKLFKGETDDIDLMNNSAFKQGYINVDNELLVNYTFENLDDNEKNEYYSLYVRAKSNRGDYSSYTTAYHFRIDTSAPENLIVQSSTHPDKNTAYSSSNVVFYWDNPIDMTGVKEFRYVIRDKEKVLVNNDSSLVSINGDRRTLVYTLPDDLVEGTISLYVEAIDYGGLVNNENTNTKEVKINRHKPKISILGIDNKPEELKTTINWSVENAHTQNIILEFSDGSYSRVLTGNINSCTLDGLVPGELYTLKIYGYSDAQPPCSVVKSIQFEVDDETDSIIVPPKTVYTNQFLGFRVDGEYVPENYGLASGTLFLPETLSFMDNNTSINNIELNEVVIDNKGEFLSGESDINFITNLHGFKISASEHSRLLLNRETGLQLTNRVITYPINTYDHFDLEFGDIYIQDGILRPLSGYVELDNSISIQTTIESHDTWFIEDVYNISLYNRFLKLDSGVVNLFGINHLLLTNILLDHDREFQSCDIKNDFNLDFGLGAEQVTIHVTESQLVRDELVILEARLINSEDFLVYDKNGISCDVKISNLRINKSGEVISQPTLVNPFYISNEKNQFYIDQLEFSNVGVKGSGYVLLDSVKVKNSNFSNLGLTNSGISTTYIGTLDNNISFTTSTGYDVNANGSNVYITDMGYHLEKATVDLSLFQAGKTITIYDLAVGFDLSEILTPGSTTKNSTITSTTLQNLEYYSSSSDYIDIEDITLSETGLIAKNVSFNLPNYFDTKVIQITEIPMLINPDNNFGYFGRGIIKNPVGNLKLSNGYELSIIEAYYENGEIFIPQYMLNLPSGSSENQLLLNNMVFNYYGIDLGVMSEDFSYSDKSWTFMVEDPVFSIDGIRGVTSLKLPINDIDQQIYLDNFLLKANGAYTLKKTEVIESYIMYQGFSGCISGVQLTGNSLFLDELKLSYNGQNLVINDVVFDNSGVVIDYGKGQYCEKFESKNGFIVKNSTPELTFMGISLSGAVLLPDYFGNDVSVTLDNSELKLSSDWNLTSDSISQDIAVDINGVESILEDFIFIEDGIFNESVSVCVNDQKITINNSLITPHNTILNSGYIEESHITRHIAGWPVMLTSGKLVDDGILLSSIIELPEELGSPTIYLDDMLLYYEDSIVKFRSNTVINSLEFEVEDFLFEMERIRLNPDFLDITNTNITLPVNETFNGQRIVLSYLKIDKNGNFKLSGSEVEPIPMWGFDIYINDLSLEGEDFNIEGAVQFPDDFNIYELAGKKVLINEFNYNFDTKETVFEIELNNVSVEITDGWTTEFSSLNISSSGIIIGQGELFFPDNWLDNISVESTGFTDLYYDFNTNEFDIGEIYINELEVDCEGYEFIISSASYSGSSGFTLGGEFPLPGLFQGVEEDPILIVETLQIVDDFSIKQLTAGVQVSNLSFTENRELLFSGYIGIDTSLENINVDLSGVFTVGSTFSIPSMINSEIEIEEFEYDVLNNEIVSLIASYSNDEQQVFDLTIDDFIFGVNYTNNDSIMKFTLGGSTLLQETYPGIGGENFSLYGEFDSCGKILAFDSSLTIENDKSFVSDLTLKSGSNITIEALTNDNDELDGFEFSLKEAALEFSDTFSIESLQGGDISITSLILNTSSGFESCDLSFNTPDNMEILDNIILNNGSISLYAEGVDDIKTSITGTMQLPENMGGIQVDIITFVVDNTGNFEINTSCEMNEAILFDELKLSEISVDVYAESGISGLTFDLGGKLSILNSSIPKSIRSASLKADITFSTDSGLEYFNAELKSEGELSHNLIDGVTIVLDSLNFNDNGFSSESSLIVRDGFMGLDGEISTTGEITMDWNGDIIDSDLTIASLNLEYASMGLSVTDMTVNQNGIDFVTAMIELPDALGNQVVGIENGGINLNGNFYGDFIIDVLTIDILGCQIELHKPDFDMESEVITSLEAVFLLPEALGSAEISLDDVSIDESGLNISGGSFALPDIDAGGLKFSNMGATLIIDGDEYEIGATGNVFMAGIGEVQAEISLVNIEQPDYPIGLKYASFGFETKVGGLPLGATGLLLTGVRGGLAFGPPGEDLPEYYRDKFGTGMRIELGVTIVDASYTVRGSSDLWMNVENYDFAIKGELEFLESLFTAWAEALYTQDYGLELSAGIDVDLLDKLFIEGLVRAHIFEESNKARFCSEISASVSVKNLWKGFPNKPLSLGKIGLEAGDFKEERRGIKGYVTLDLFGTKGVYYGTDGTFALGNVDEYILLDDDMRSVRSNGIIRSTVGKRFRLISSTPNLEKRSAGIRSESNKRERIIFYVESEEGDPILTAISPSGVRYNEGDENVITRRQENQIYMAIVNPQDGEWSMEVSNLVVGSDYSVDAIGFFKNPEITLDTPKFTKELVNDSYTIEGSFNGNVDADNIISIYASREYGRFNGQEVATFTAENNSSFTYEINTRHLGNGEYYLYAGIYDGKNPELYRYAEGSIVINNAIEDMPKINDVIVGVTDNRFVDISFTNPIGSKVKGFYLNINNRKTGEEEQLNLGYLTKFTLSTLNNSNSYLLSITPYDNSGQLGEKSNEVFVDFTTKEMVLNLFEVRTTSVDIDLGYDSEVEIEITPLDYLITESSMDYVELIIDEIPDFMTYKSNIERVRLDSINSFKLSLISLSELDDADIQLGEHFITGRVRNIGNNSLEESFRIPVYVGYKTPLINNVTPETWHVYDSINLEIKGSGFYEDTTVDIGGHVCEVLDQNATTLWVNVPKLAANNNGLLNIKNPTAKISSKEMTLLKPSYSVNTIKDYTEITPGGKAWLYSKIKTYNRYTNSVSFSLIDQPKDWGVTILDEITTDQNFVMEVQVPDSAKTGYYSITVESNGELIEYYISVIEHDPNPTISALSSHAGSWGDIITIYGYGITEETVILLNNVQLNTYEYKEDCISFTVPDDATNGIISLVNDDIRSNGAEFEIKDDNFSIYPMKSYYDLLPGASVTNKVFIKGYADLVDIELIANSPDINVTTNKKTITPNGDFDMDITLSNAIKSGVYLIVIKGIGDRNVKEEIITISVGDNIQFTEKSLDYGKIDMDYSTFLKVKNNINDYQFHLEEGSYLPQGLYLNSESGEIYGKPTQAGTFLFSINVFESELRQNVKEFEIIILDSGWFRKEGPAGNNMYNHILSPAENKTIWEYSDKDSVEAILSSQENLFVINSTKIRVLNRCTGLTKYILDAKSLKTVLVGNLIINLENRYEYIYNEDNGIKEPILEDSYLVIYQQDSGEELVAYSGVTDFDTIFNTIYMSQDSSTVILQVSDLYNPSILEEDIFKEHYTTTEHGFFSIDGKNICNILTDDKTELANTPDVFTTFDNWLYYVDQFGLYVETISDVEVDTGLLDSNLSVGEFFSVVYNDYEFVIINRQTQEIIRNTVFIDKLLLTRDKLLILNSDGLTAYNLFTGKEIWSKKGHYQDFISGGCFLYIKGDNNVVCIGGRSNIHAPSSSFQITPMIPDGTNGYYTSNPIFDLTVTDPESYGFAKYSTDGMNYTSYTDPVTLLDGDYTLSYNSSDDEGLTEELNEVPIKVDTINPVTSLKLDKLTGDRGYTKSHVTYTLSPTDTNSGIYQTWYSINDEKYIYTDSITISEEGDYTFDYWSIDLAGNTEQKKSNTVKIDLSNPTVRYESYEGRDFYSIYFIAEDSFSGVNRIEYKINGGDINKYHDPLFLPIGDIYNISYRAVDNSERVSKWFDINMDLSSIEPVALIENLTTSWGNKVISTNNNLQVGDVLFTKKNRGDKQDHSIKSLPSYLVGGELILDEYNNKNAWDKSFYRFNAGLTIDLYLIKNKLSNIDLDNHWSLVDENVEINEKYYPGGGDVYHRIVEEGEYVEICGSRSWNKSAPNLIVAKRNVKADISIFSPNPSKSLNPLSTNWYAASSVEGEIRRNWSYRFNGEDWVDLGEKISGEFELDYIDKDTTLELRVELVTQNSVNPFIEDITSKTRVYTVENMAELSFIEPVSGSQVLKIPNFLDYKTTDVYGEDVNVDVTWFIENGEVLLNSYIPENIGLTTLSGSYEVFEEYKKESSIKLNVVDMYESEVFTFDLGDTNRYSEDEYGRFFGFSTDHKEQLGETTYVDVPEGQYWSTNKVTKSYIALKKGENFSYLVNNGLYKVTAVLGPVTRKEEAFIIVEGEMIYLDVSSNSQIINVETSVQVEDNKITVEGSEDLQLIELQFLRTDVKGVTYVLPYSKYRIMNDMKWYKWDPGHYYPNYWWDWTEEMLIPKKQSFNGDH